MRRGECKPLEIRQKKKRTKKWRKNGHETNKKEKRLMTARIIWRG